MHRRQFRLRPLQHRFHQRQRRDGRFHPAALCLPILNVMLPLDSRPLKLIFCRRLKNHLLLHRQQNWVVCLCRMT